MAKASTKEEKYIESLKIKDIDFSKMLLFKREGFRTKKNIACMKCGCVYDNSLYETNRCPNCNTHLKIFDTLKRKGTKNKIIEVIDSAGGYQITRQFLARLKYEKGKEEELLIVETSRYFLKPNKKPKLMKIGTSSFFWDWHWSLDTAGKFEFAKPYDNYGSLKFYSFPHIIYDKIKLSDDYKYCGYSKKSILSSITYFKLYDKYPQIELFAKLGKHNYISGIYNHQRDVDLFMKPLRTAIKNNYDIKDFGLWVDYLSLAKYFEKDISSFKYACPRNLNEAHDYYHRKKLEKDILEKENQEKFKDERYAEKIKPFKDIELSIDDCKVVVIEDLETMQEEAEKLELCYMTQKYYAKGTLVLSVRKNGEPIGGIEIDPYKKYLIQIRGYDNKDFTGIEKVKQLVENSFNVFQKALVVNC